MAPIQIEDSNPPISENEIRDVEQKFGIQFPEQYRQFLLQHNGGHPEPNVFAVPGDPIPGQSSMLEWFYCIDSTDVNHIERMILTFRERMPSECIPIGCDPGGNQICLVISGDDAGKIFYWDHEEEADEGDPPTYRNMYLIADSFIDLINNKLSEGDLYK